MSIFNPGIILVDISHMIREQSLCEAPGDLSVVLLANTAKINCSAKAMN